VGSPFSPNQACRSASLWVESQPLACDRVAEFILALMPPATAGWADEIACHGVLERTEGNAVRTRK